MSGRHSSVEIETRSIEPASFPECQPDEDHRLSVAYRLGTVLWTSRIRTGRKGSGHRIGKTLRSA